MSTNNDGWILMSERKPTQEDFPVWLYDPKAKDGLPTWIHGTRGSTPYSGATHWKPAAADIPAPPRERTQREKDWAAWEKWRQQYATVDSVSTWLDALAYERAEVGKMLPAPGKAEFIYNVAAAIEAIRARCGGGK